MYGIYENGQVIAKFVAPIAVKSNRPVFASDTLSLSRKASRRVAQRWEIEARLEPLSFSAQDLFVNVVTKGYSEDVTIVVPQNYGSIQSRIINAYTAPIGAGSLNSEIINVSSNVNYIPKGTFIKFSTHNKVYMTTTNLNGNGSIGIYPGLQEAVNTTFTHLDDVIMHCLYDFETMTGMSYIDGILMDLGTVKLVENLV